MATLQALPVELLEYICQALGGHELRKGKGLRRLTLFRKWYAAARLVFLSGHNLETIRIYGHRVPELRDGSWSPTGDRELMHEHTRTLHLRIPGHWWDAVSSQEFEELMAGQAEKGNVYDVSGLKQAQDVAPERAISPMTGVLHNTAWKEWRADIITPALNELFADLENFTALKSLIFEAWRDKGITPPYIYANAIRSLCQHLPLAHNLMDLTLDISGFDIVRTGGSNQGCENGVCQSLGLVWPRVKNVRIRMKRYCEVLFSAAQTLSKADIRCQSFILKLHHPSVESHFQPSQHCGTGGYMTSHRLPEIMVAAAQKYLCWMSARSDQANIKENVSLVPILMRISYLRSTNIVTADCLTMRVLSKPEEFFIYEDDGMPSWYETRQDLVDCGEFLPWDKRLQRT